MNMTQTDTWESTRKSRGHDRDEQRALTALVRRQRRFAGALTAAGQKLKAAPAPVREPSKRVGEKDGHPTRTYTNQWRPAPKAAGLVTYIDRLNGKKLSDLEQTGGLDAAEFTRLAEEREQSIKAAGVSKRTAALEQMIEFPYDTTPEIRAEIMREITRGHEPEVTWAIHAGGKDGKEQPHTHILWLSGPQGQRPVEGSKAMAANRHHVAMAINSAFQRMTGRRLEAEFWGGKDRDLDSPGIVGRPPKRRKTRPIYECQRKRDELVKAGQPVPERILRLAAAGDRLDEMNRTAAQNGLKEQPLSGKEGRIADYGRMQSEISILKQHWAPATPDQADFIADRAERARVKLPAGWKKRLDGGDMMAAVKAAERGGAELFAEKIAEAEKRAALRAPIIQPILDAHQAEIARLEQRIAELSGQKVSEPVPSQQQHQGEYHGNDSGRDRADGSAGGRDSGGGRGGRDVIAALRAASDAVDVETTDKVGAEIAEMTAWNRAAEGAAEAVAERLEWQKGIAAAISDNERDESFARFQQAVDAAEGAEIAVVVERVVAQIGAEIADRLGWQAGVERATEEAQATALTRGIEQAADAAGRAIADRLAWQRSVGSALVDAERAADASAIEQITTDAGRDIADRLRWQAGFAAALGDAERAGQAAAIQRAAEAAGTEITVSVRIDLAAALAATEISETAAWDRSAAAAVGAVEIAKRAAAIEQAATQAAAEIADRAAWARVIEMLSEPAGLPAITAAAERLRNTIRRIKDEHRSAECPPRSQESGGRGVSAGPDDDDRRHLGDDQGGGGQEDRRRTEPRAGGLGIAGGSGQLVAGREQPNQGAARPHRSEAGPATVTFPPVPKAVVQPSKLAPPAAPSDQRFSVRTTSKSGVFSVRDATLTEANGQSSIVGYINTNTTNGAAVFRAYHGGEKDAGPLAHLSGKPLDAAKPDTFARQISAMATPPSVERVPVRPAEVAVGPTVAPPVQTAVPVQAPAVGAPLPPAPQVAPVVPAAVVDKPAGKAIFWPQPRIADGADANLLEARRAARHVEIKGRSDAELLADRGATKAKITAMIAEKNPAGARGYEQGLAVVDAEAKARGLPIDPPPDQTATRAKSKVRDREQDR